MAVQLIIHIPFIQVKPLTHWQTLIGMTLVLAVVLAKVVQSILQRRFVVSQTKPGTHTQLMMLEVVPLVV
jgi:hypothetical protein